MLGRGEELVSSRPHVRECFCIIKLLQEVSRLAILTRIGHKNIYNIPLYSNEYISA